MVIQRKPKTTPAAQAAAVDAFVSGAPDAGAYNKGVAKGNKRQISLTITPDLLRRVDELAKRTGQGRAGIINMAIYRAIEGDVFK
ncbi:MULTISPECIES: ribbon-helix-helix domain-containing protein [unclassified Acidiphilium]|uniref:ribbon-helix-helix domain-containing protein n=1 Tax=unclassified Acidiphilium TaxID=2617493 RepID=UPI000BC5E79B|nr:MULTISPECIES: ribbon-helix-helix domain-containing protein [unclassified Acidiphilium]OYV54176.1 MAG: CopG family transcriptional regulator [Acidiphilium sp. 20-67-58]HQT65502.1 ribbon-helix-helix domain-containing protein [Acidocella sp.]